MRMGCAAFAATADQNLVSEQEQHAKSCLCMYSGYFSLNKQWRNYSVNWGGVYSYIHVLPDKFILK
jgi:formylmethanofuran dehydrogenase subunit E-like metal-binding protein